MNEEQRIRWLNTCTGCKKFKINMPKARCDIAYGMKVKSKTTLDNVRLFSNKHGDCKFYEGIGE